jgi:hypothetical protein
MVAAFVMLLIILALVQFSRLGTKPQTNRFLLRSNRRQHRICGRFPTLPCHHGQVPCALRPSQDAQGSSERVAGRQRAQADGYGLLPESRGREGVRRPRPRLPCSCRRVPRSSTLFRQLAAACELKRTQRACHWLARAQSHHQPHHGMAAAADFACKQAKHHV